MIWQLPLCRTRVAAWLLAAGFLLDSGTAAAEEPARIPVFVTQARQVSIADRIEALGTLRANESVALTTSVTETVTSLHFDDGDRVAAGQVLVEMTSGEEHAQLEEAKATVAEARRQYERIKSLRETQIAAESLLDQRRREWETGRARLAAIESRLADRLVRAPFAGVVGTVYLRPGESVVPGTPVLVVGDASALRVETTDLNEVDATQVGVGSPVTLSFDALPGSAIAGEIVRLAPMASSGQGGTNFTAVIDMTNPPETLRWGMTAFVDIEVE